TEPLPFYYKFGEIFQTIGKYCQDNGQAIALVIGCLVIFLIIIVAILFITSLFTNQKNNMIQERNEKGETILKRTPEFKKTEQSVNIGKLGIGKTAGILREQTDSKTLKVEPHSPTTKQESKARLIISFEYVIQEADQPEGFFDRKISEVIKTTNIPAGSVGVPYEYVIDFTPLAIDLKITEPPKPELDFRNTGFEVTAEENKIIIKGTPRNTIDENIWFFFGRENKKIGQDESGYSLKSKPFLINPHPRDLWQNLPVEDYEGYQNKDSDARGDKIDYVLAKKGILLTTPPQSLEVIAASQRGRSHAHVGKPREDSFHFEFDAETGWNFIAVADGAGSAKFSRKGSELACNTVISRLRANLQSEHNNDLAVWINNILQESKSNPDQPTMFPFRADAEMDRFGVIFHKAIYDAYMAIYDEAKLRNAEVKDYHTTLLCAVFRYFENLKRWFIVSYWVGDGGAAILRWNGKERAFVLGEPDGGEFAGQTKFLTMKDEINAEAIRKRLRFSFCETFGAMIFVTDGITDPFFPSESAVGDEKRWLEFYEQKLRNGCQEEPNAAGCQELFDKTKTPQEKSKSLLSWLDFWSKGNHDDRTILIVKDVD
ncbi:MAG: protein phosphatase 2C domain-containing protein, partial [Planctomycetaceae bacterium]|nr:protein phosphatase 2C domain-containing protein [Planctomycetaceae bacterium]